MSFDQKKSFSDNNSFFLIMLLIVGIYYVAKLVYFVFTIPIHVPPDEITHFNLCRLFAHCWGLPVNSEETFRFGDVEHTPWLYYYLMGKLLRLNFFHLGDLIYLRLWNALLSVITVIYAYQWFSILSPNLFARISFSVIMTNIAMWTFLGATVHYDNMVNFSAVASLYYFHHYIVNGKRGNILWCGIFLSIGCLVKISFLPYAFIVSIFFSFLIFRKENSFKNLLEISSYTLFEKMLLTVFVVLFVLCSNLYFSNYIKFHKLIPAPQQIMTEKQLMEQRIAARDYIIDKFSRNEWSYQKAVEKARTITHPGDQLTALSVLRIIKDFKEKPRPVKGLGEYSFVWLKNMLASCVGIAGHRSLLKSSAELTIYQWFFVILIIFSLFGFIQSSRKIILTQSTAIVLFYSLVLLIYHNYRIYLSTMNLVQGMQGRYLFPVLVPFIGILISSSFELPWKKIISIFFFVSSLVFVWGDFPYFIGHVNATWYRPLSDCYYYYRRGVSFRESNLPLQAVTEYKEAVRLCPENSWYHRFLGDIYIELHLDGKALYEYLEALRLQPKNAGFRYLAGRQYQKMGMLTKAEQQYEAAVRLAPKNRWYHRFSGDLFLQLGKFEQAYEQYRLVLQIDPDNLYCKNKLKDSLKN